jgi:hypothetical protein
MRGISCQVAHLGFGYAYYHPVLLVRYLCRACKSGHGSDDGLRAGELRGAYRISGPVDIITEGRCKNEMEFMSESRCTVIKILGAYLAALLFLLKLLNLIWSLTTYLGILGVVASFLVCYELSFLIRKYSDYKR